MGRGRRGWESKLEALRARIEQWRRTRTTRAMPEELWAAAVGLTGSHGVYAVAHALRLNYGTLKARVAERDEDEAHDVPSGFVEAPMLVSSGVAESVVELSRADGARMTIRLSGSVDVAELTAAFVGAPR